ncbi:type IV pilus biogenesis/stability protein PilW [Thauera linaloolentis]|uniref:Putative type 4 pilus biogenesis protein n=1 Tax=Thauera linaloolentis (strain DSM 12138 / JCM 21573 / CCUG 41526 / CIP 105981 / IAM 15112 / NBRC 102519 / 47Lol) TaxID=1123367 RepID=N6YTZ7_THAL4|nr:type IV pilus biogenesis/stability protein PilW [Thauera linaloolentis]ENO85653.1 putative type 4 pilus biogenesis protein [Thauera linaloolentis 47Lol = DSM 12138]MCM8564137.1 type IV pilus biogenesis/stability protein PilW [Thauera linaloolentis]
MKQSVVLAGMLLAALVGAGCATVPGAPSAGASAVSRPLSDVPPSTPAETRARVHVDLGMAYFEVGRYDVALDEARIALNDSPGYAPAYHLFGLAYMLIEEHGPARQNFELALRHAPGDPEFSNSYGWFLCSRGEELRGLEYLAQSARNPYYRHATRPYTNAGLCHLRLKDDAAAETQFLAALQVDPSNAQALYQLADIAYRGGRYDQARSLLIRLHQQSNPTAASAWLGLRTERRLGNRDAEASYASQLGSRFGTSEEYQKMTQGKYE